MQSTIRSLREHLHPDAHTDNRKLPAVCHLCAVAVFGAAVGLMSLWIAAQSCLAVSARELYAFYLSDARLLALNLLPPMLLAFFGYCIFSRVWAAVLTAAVPALLLSCGNYFKILLRDEPVIFSDLILLRTAGGIMGKYNVVPTAEMHKMIALCLGMLAVSLLLLPRCRMKRKTRIIGAAACIAVSAVLLASVYFSDGIYRSTAVPEGLNANLDTESCAAHGCFYPFLHSARPDRRDGLACGTMTPQEKYESYTDADIPEAQKVQVMGIMCEALADFSQVGAFADNEKIQAIYAPLHELEARSVSGNLLSNSFGGGTTNTEWCVVSGYSQGQRFQEETETYVWYFAEQGYDTLYQHPGNEWFYERKDINPRMGYQEQAFSENCFGEQVDVTSAMFHSDGILVDYLLDQFNSRTETDAPMFSFSVTIQNHGPYNAEITAVPDFLGENPGWAEASYNILSNYFYGIDETIRELVRLTDGLEESEEPVVLFVFGDHKPWLGDNKAVYYELGLDMDFSETEGFYNTFATPYFIWANSAAKEALGRDFTGDGGDFSPCFLMPRVFEACGWDGPGFMQYAREMRAVTPVLSQKGLFLQNGAVCAEMNEEDTAFYNDFLSVQSWRGGSARANKKISGE